MLALCMGQWSLILGKTRGPDCFCGGLEQKVGQHRPAVRGCSSLQGLAEMPARSQGQGRNEGRLHIQILALSLLFTINSCSKSPRSTKKAHTAMTSTSRKALQGPVHAQSCSWVTSLASCSDETKLHEAPGQGPVESWSLKSPHSAAPVPQAKTDLCFS